MADLGTLITIADKVYQLLQSPVLKDMKNWESDLGKLNRSVSFIKDLLLDTDTKPALSHGEQRWVDELNEVLYEADDLFDEVITVAKRKELNAAGAKFSEKVLDKVSRFFSSNNRILVSYNTSQEVNSIQKKLDAIAKDHARYDFKVDPQATLKRKEETCSFLNATHENIIGREDDVKVVVDMLLDPNVEENVGFVAVVGIETTKNPIMSILNLSYNNLEPSVKNCFKYCALSPKDFEMNKRELIYLWMAQGYIGDSEDCFLILLKRCFFQDVRRDDLGDITSFKMHDLMHDLAQEVAGDEIIVGNSLPNNLSKKIRHLFLDGEEWAKSSFSKGNIRTCYMNTKVHSDMVQTLVANWRCLRTLRFYVPDDENLPGSIGELLHLRYLDLSDNKNLKTLPNSITKLYNLQSLILKDCWSLEEWPKDFCKLVNLRLLDINRCPGLTCMPLGIDQLTNLRDLTKFKVGEASSVGKQLNDLKFLVNLRGRLGISISGNHVSENENKWEGGYLEHIKNLKALEILFPYEAQFLFPYEALIEKLQPSRNLMELTLEGYNGTEITRWGRAQDDWAIVLPNLVHINLSNCESLHGIPLLSHLKHLKFLSLFWLSNLEYMEPSAVSRCGSRSKDLPFFPSLEYLSIWRLEKLKGWWGGDSSSGMPMSRWQPPFPRLSKLTIKQCPELASLPPCPTLEFLIVNRCNKLLRILPGQEPANLDLKLNVEVDSAGYLTTLPARRLTDILIQHDAELKGLPEFEEVFKTFSSLRKLEIRWCSSSLTSVSGVLEHLTALESLSISEIPVVDGDFDDDMPWRSKRHNLRSLRLRSLKTLQILPGWMKHLTCLQDLSISDCESLKGLPEWISCLSSLHSLTIIGCPNLKSLGALQNITSLQKLEILNCRSLREACEEPSGKEWPNIQHIPHISINGYSY